MSSSTQQASGCQAVSLGWGHRSQENQHNPLGNKESSVRKSQENCNRLPRMVEVMTGKEAALAGAQVARKVLSEKGHLSERHEEARHGKVRKGIPGGEYS